MERMCGTGEEGKTLDISNEIQRKIDNGRVQVTVKKDILRIPIHAGIDEKKAHERISLLLKEGNIVRDLASKNCRMCPVMGEEYTLPAIPSGYIKSKTWVVGYMPTKNSGIMRVPFSDGTGILIREMFEKERIFPYYTYLCNCCCNISKDILKECMWNYFMQQLKIGQPSFIFCLDPVIKILEGFMTNIEKKTDISFLCNLTGCQNRVMIYSIPDFNRVSSIPNDSVMQVRKQIEDILKKIIGGN